MKMQPEVLSEEQITNQSQRRMIREYNLGLVRSYLRESYVSITSYSVMLIMFAISVFMTYSQNGHSLQHYSLFQLNPLVLIKLGANYGLSVKNGQIHRLFTPIFLHANLQHLFLNSISIFALVMMVQKKFKKPIFLFTFFIGGAQGNLLSSFVNFIEQKNANVSVGASTSICAVLGLYLATIYIISMKNGNVQQVKKQIYYMIAYLFIVSLMPGVDFYGHFGSFIAGGLIGLSFSGLKVDFAEDNTMIKRIKLIALILYVIYTILLLVLFII